MKINISKKNTIKNYTDWFCFAPPKRGKKQWKEGRSALEFARFATSKSFENLINELVKDLDLKSKSFECEPEAETSFPVKKMGHGGPRNHDLLMIGEDCIIGVEAKVSEAFDKTIREKRKDATSNMEQRLNGAIKYIFGDNKPENVENLKYQLFSAIIGTTEEVKKAKNPNINTAVILILVFTGDVAEVKEGEVERNNNDYKDFIETLHVDEKGGFKVADTDSIQCYIRKIEVGIKKNITYTYKF